MKGVPLLALPGKVNCDSLVICMLVAGWWWWWWWCMAGEGGEAGVAIYSAGEEGVEELQDDVVEPESGQWNVGTDDAVISCPVCSDGGKDEVLLTLRRLGETGTTGK